MKNIFITKLLAALILITSCSDDEKDIYIVNSTYSIEMSSEGGTQNFGFRTNGEWSVSSNADWLTFDNTSGNETGSLHQHTNVTAARYDGFENRKAKIIITSNGATNYIDVIQRGRVCKPELKIFELSHGLAIIGWDMVDGWRDLNARKFKVELAETKSGNIIRSYTSNITSTKYCYNRFVFGKLNPDENYTCHVTLLSNNERLGDSDTGSIEFTTKPAPTISDNTLLYKDFDNFWLGGNAIWGAFGVDIADDIFKSFSLSTEFSVPVEPTTNTVKNVLDGFSANATTEYKTDRWGTNFDDWKKGGSTRIYETAGFIKFGTSSNNGVLVTPQLSQLSEASNISINFKACPYSEPNSNGNMTIEPTVEEGLSFKISIIGSGKFSGDKTSLTLKNTSNTNNNPDTDRLQWTQHNISISNADATTRVKIETLSSSGNYRMWLDDLIIEKI